MEAKSWDHFVKIKENGYVALFQSALSEANDNRISNRLFKILIFISLHVFTFFGGIVIGLYLQTKGLK